MADQESSFEKNLARLTAAGLVDVNQLTDEQRKAIASLSDSEVESLISSAQKLGASSMHYDGLVF
jgi:hypothetical protein